MNPKRLIPGLILALLFLALGFAGTVNAQEPEIEWNEWSEWTPVVEQWRNHNTPATLLQVELEEASFVEVQFEQTQVHDSNDNCAPQFNEEARVSFADNVDYFLDGVAEDNRVQQLTFNSFLEAGSYPAVSEWAGDWMPDEGCKTNGSYEIRARMRTGKEIPPRGEVEWSVGTFCTTDGYVGGRAFARNTSTEYFVDWSVQLHGWTIGAGRLMPGEETAVEVVSQFTAIPAGNATVTFIWENGDTQTFVQSFDALDCELPPPPVDYSLTITADETCETWSVTAAAAPEGAVITYDPAQSGEWEEDQESVTVTVTATWPDGTTRTAEVVIEKPVDCDEEPEVCRGTTWINFDWSRGPQIDGTIWMPGQGLQDPVPSWTVNDETRGWSVWPMQGFTMKPGWTATHVEVVFEPADGGEPIKLKILNWLTDQQNSGYQIGQYGWVACNMFHSVEVAFPDDVAELAANPTADINHAILVVAEAEGWQVGEVVETVEVEATEAETAPPTEYIVIAGDTVVGIAEFYGLSMFDVLSWNDLEYTVGQPVIIVPGQVLSLIPTG